MRRDGVGEIMGVGRGERREIGVLGILIHVKAKSRRLLRKQVIKMKFFEVLMKKNAEIIWPFLGVVLGALAEKLQFTL